MLEGKQKKDEEARKEDMRNVKDIVTRPDTPLKVDSRYQYVKQAD